MHAAYRGHADAVQCLLTHGANVNAVKNNGETVLHYAAQCSPFDAVEIVLCLLEHGANVNAVNNNGETALHYAANIGWTDTMQCLLEHGAHVNAATKHGETALHWAAESGHKEAVQCLLEHGADVKAIREIPGPLLNRLFSRKTARDLAAKAGHTDIVRLLDNY